MPEYWIVDVDARVVKRWRPTDERPEVITDLLAWHPDAAMPGLQLNLPAFFANVLDERHGSD